MDKILDPSICGWDTANFLIFSENVFGDFIYYSHIFPALSALILGFFIFKHNKKDNVAKLLFLTTIVFALWSFFDLILWATEKTNFTMFFWSILIHFDLLLYVLSFYFVFTFLFNKLPDWKTDLVTFLLFVPVALFGHTSLNLVAFDYTNCWREAIEGPLWKYYVYNVELFISLGILLIGMYATIKASKEERKQQIFVVIGILLFLTMFSAGNIAGSLNIDWEMGQYGLFGMAILVAILGYLVTRYKTFNTTVLTSEILITTLSVLILSLLFVPEINNVRIISSVTFLFTITIGLLLIRSNKKDIAQRDRIEELATTLNNANNRLKELDKMKSEFVSIASHQLRSPLTAIRGYASMLAEGTYGNLPVKAQVAAGKIADSSKFMAMSIEDYLNVSRIESGNMKYEMTDFNLRDITEKLVDEMRQVAIKKGLVMIFRSDCSGSALIHADIGKVRQVIMNLLDNSMKYTLSGTITVVAHDDVKAGKMRVTIKDTGVGLNKETLEELFDKFVRARNANHINATGTGLGLFVAKKMLIDMGGKVWAESEGEGKGSTFTVEFSMLHGNPSMR